MVPSLASAHTELISSNPTAGQVVKEELNEIVLTYEGEIESLSTIKLIKDGQEIPFASVAPKDNQLKGTISNSLEDGAYTINWNIAGEDGHPLTGEIPFTVQKEVTSDQQAETKEPVTKEPVTKEPVTTKEDSKNQNTEQEKTNNQTTDSSLNPTIITVVVLLVVVIGLYMLFRRKRK
jgi:methionine-rich copper-binding protein CopC